MASKRQIGFEYLKRESWDQKPEETNPLYVAFVLYCSLGPQRDWIVEHGIGKQLWDMLMAGLKHMDEDEPLPVVCHEMIGALRSMLREDFLDHVGKNDENYAFIKDFHVGLQTDDELRSLMGDMISNLEKLKRGERLHTYIP